jgi:hypothetical protein
MSGPQTRLMTSADIYAAAARRQSPGLRLQTFHEGNFQPAGLPAATVVDVVTFALPNMMQGQLEGFTFGCEVLGDFDQIVWQLLIDGTPQQGFEFLQGPQSTFVFPKILPAPLPVRANGVIAVRARVLAATVGQIAAAILGTYWPSQSGEHQQDFPGHVSAQL